MNRRHTDLFEWAQRTLPFALAAEIQRRLLPPAFTCEAGQFTFAGWLEPANTVGGDTFDYALDRDTLHVSITDAVGHDVQAAMLATVLVGSLRNGRRARRRPARAGRHRQRRAGLALAPSATSSPGSSCGSTSTDGTAMLVNAGHPFPLRLRDGRVEEIELDIDLPFGLEPGRVFRVQRSRCSPATGSCLITDGMFEPTRRAGRAPRRSRARPTCTPARSCTPSATRCSGLPAATCATTPPWCASTGTAGRRTG